MMSELTAPGLLRRMACWLYEGMLLFAVLFISGYLFSTLSQTRHALDNRHGLQAFLFLVVGIYFTWFGHKGQTLAMKTWHIRALDVHGQPLTHRRAWARYVLSWLWFVPPLVNAQLIQAPLMVGLLLCPFWIVFWACLTYFRTDHQFLHDYLAGTRLVDVRPAKLPAT
jgi:uncharacterized RDD family membrane protein YckC